MSGHAIHHPCVLVLHLALNRAWRKVVSSSVGGIETRAAGIRAKSRSRHPERHKDLAPDPARQTLAQSALPSALPSRMKPGSEYSARAPGSAYKGNSRQARNSASGVVAVRKNST